MAEPLRLTFLGTGDPFGTGGRFQSAILLDGAHGRYLLDCGATTPLALARAGIDPNTIDGIIITHCVRVRSGWPGRLVPRPGCAGLWRCSAGRHSRATTTRWRG
jgi:hypothetical protein